MFRTSCIATSVLILLLASSASADSAPGEVWLANGLALAAEADAAAARAEAAPAAPAATRPADAPPPGEAKPYVPWRQRYGPAYPDDPWRSAGRWAQELPATLLDDTVFTFTDPAALIVMTAGIGGGAIVSCTADSDVADHYRQHGHCLPGWLDNLGDTIGHPGVHFGVAGAMYVSSLVRESPRDYERSKTLINALAINGLFTLALKGIADTDVPNGNDYGWPSGHTSSSFCFASVMHRQYGWRVGLPCYVAAAFVGYERVDARNHDLSDVVSGALIGIAIGHAVARNHDQRLELLGMDVVPYSPRSGGVGLALVGSW